MLQSVKRVAEDREGLSEEGTGEAAIILDKTTEFCKQVGGEQRDDIKGI